MSGNLNPQTRLEFYHVADAVLNLDYAGAVEVLRGVQRVVRVQAGDTLDKRFLQYERLLLYGRSDFGYHFSGIGGLVNDGGLAGLLE